MRVLLVDGSPEDAFFIVRELAADASDVQTVSRLGQAMNTPDLDHHT